MVKNSSESFLLHNGHFLNWSMFYLIQIMSKSTTNITVLWQKVRSQQLPVLPLRSFDGFSTPPSLSLLHTC